MVVPSVNPPTYAPQTAVSTLQCTHASHAATRSACQSIAQNHGMSHNGAQPRPVENVNRSWTVECVDLLPHNSHYVQYSPDYLDSDLKP